MLLSGYEGLPDRLALFNNYKFPRLFSVLSPRSEKFLTTVDSPAKLLKVGCFSSFNVDRASDVPLFCYRISPPVDAASLHSSSTSVLGVES